MGLGRTEPDTTSTPLVPSAAAGNDDNIEPPIPIPTDEPDTISQMERDNFKHGETVAAIPKRFIGSLFSVMSEKIPHSNYVIDYEACEEKDLFYFFTEQQMEFLKIYHSIKGDIKYCKIFIFDQYAYLEKNPLRIIVKLLSNSKSFETTISRAAPFSELKKLVFNFFEEKPDEYQIVSSIREKRIMHHEKKFVSQFINNVSSDELILFLDRIPENSEDEIPQEIDLSKEYPLHESCELSTSNDDFGEISDSDDEELKDKNVVPCPQTEEEIKNITDGVQVKVHASNDLENFVLVTISRSWKAKEVKTVSRKALGLRKKLNHILLLDWYNKNVYKVFRNDDDLINNPISGQDYLLDIKTNGHFVHAEEKESRTYSYTSYSYAPTPASRPGLVGLSNLGNTCYMNSALQCLSNTVPLRNFLMDDSKLAQDLNPDNPLSRNGEFATELSLLLKKMWASNALSSVSPDALRGAIGRHIPTFQGFSQQDAHELLSSVLDGLHEDLNRIRKKPYVENLDFDPKKETEMEYSFSCWDRFQKRNDSIITDLFFSQTRTIIDCPICASHVIKFEPNTVICVPVPQENVNLTVYIVPFKDMRKVEISDSFYYQANISVPETCEGIVLRNEIQKLGLTDFYIIKKDFHSYYLVSDADVCNVNSYYVSFFIYEKSPEDVAFEKIVKDKRENSKSNEKKTVTELDEETKNEVVKARKEGRTLVIDSLDDSETGDELSDDIQTRLLMIMNGKKIESSYTYYGRTYTQSRLEDVGNLLLFEVSADITSKDLYKAVFEHLKQQIKNPILSERITKCFEELENGAIPVIQLEEDDSSSDDDSDDDSDEEDSDEDEKENEEEKEKKEGKEDKEKKEYEVELPAAEKKKMNKCVVPFVITVEYSGYSVYSVIKDNSKTLLFDDQIAIENVPGMNFCVRVIWNPNEKNTDYLDKPFNDRTNYPSFTKDSKEVNPAKGPITLGCCLERFSEPSVLSEDDMWYCPTCKEHRQAKVQTSLWRTPKILVVALKRFIYHGQVRSKIDTLVNYSETLIVHDHLLGKDVTYHLYAIINHSGGLHGGHYVASAKQNGMWCDFNDSFASERSSTVSVSSSAYVLFYQKADVDEMPDELISSSPQLADESDSSESDDMFHRVDKSFGEPESSSSDFDTEDPGEELDSVLEHRPLQPKKAAGFKSASTDEASGFESASTDEDTDEDI